GPGAPLPLHGGRKERAAASLERGVLHARDHVAGGALQRARERTIGAVQQRVVEIVGVDEARAREEDALLTPPERMLRRRCQAAPAAVTEDHAATELVAVARQPVHQRARARRGDALDDGVRPAGAPD